MGRYTNIEIKTPAGIRRYKTELLTIPPATDDIILQITTPERLDKLSQEFYGTPSLWWTIASINSLKGSSYMVASNTIIRIPTRDRITSYIEQLNTTR
jgi:hypothetical protein